MAQDHSQFALLRTRRFWPLFVVQGLGAFNDQVFKTGFVALITYRLADELGLNAGLHNTMAAGLFILPFALVAPTAGAIADGMDKARMMRRVKAAEVVLMVLAAIAYHLQSLPLLYGLLLLMGAQSAFFSPIKYSVLPQYLAPHELVAGNGLVQAATFLAILLGQMAGATLVLTPAGITLISVVVIIVALAGFGASIHAPPAPPLGPAPRPDWLLPRAVWQVVAEARGEPAPFHAILAIGWFWFTGAVYLTLVLPFAKETLGADEGVSVLLLATFSVGVAVGALLCNRLFGGVAKLGIAPLGAAGIGVFAMLLWLSVQLHQPPQTPGMLLTVGDFLLSGPGAWGVLACFAALACCAGIYVTPLNVLLQVTAPAAARGRFIACSNVVDAALMTLSSIVVAVLLLGGLSHETIFLIVGLSGFAAALWVHGRRHLFD